MSGVRSPRALLVTGGAGFIGSAFIRRLFRDPSFGGKVINLDLLTYAGNPENLKGSVDQARYTLVRGDIADQKLVEQLCEEHRVDAIVNFAAESHVDRSIVGPGVFVQTNIVGTFSLLEVVRKRPSIHFHHVSTDEVYGSLGATGLFTEQTAYDPSSPYSASKAASDHLVRAYQRTYGLSTTVSNCSNNYGPYHFPEKLIPLMILNLFEGKELPVYGDGLNVRDWLFVDDHAEALWVILTRGRRGQTYNVGGNNEWTNLAIVTRLIELVAQLKDKPLAELEAQIRFVKDRPGHDRRYAIDSSKLQQELGWSPRHDLDTGLAETVRWYADNAPWVDGVRSGAYRDWIEQNYGTRG
ncbi:MAG TPA: dTDP-glucose 4,6-dehydratase [Polyangiaceae bacterium]|nr:dTDP-glucose 4,6-dehydratase [Polyangiaceae bacterium]